MTFTSKVSNKSIFATENYSQQVALPSILIILMSKNNNFYGQAHTFSPVRGERSSRA